MTTAMTIPSTINNGQVTELTTAKGKVVGTRIVFGGENRASDVKAALKKADSKLKGAELTKKVNEVLTGRNTLAWAEYEVSVSAMRSAGYQPDNMDIRKASGTARFVKPTEPKSTVSSVKEKIAAMSDAERAALMAELFADATAPATPESK